jgi:hypothetical protein
LSALVHIGLPKCASTSIQSALAGARGARFLGKSAERPGPLAAIAGWLGRDVKRRNYADPVVQDLARHELPHAVALSDATIARRAAHLADLAARTPGKALVLSDEVLSGAGFVVYGRARRSQDQIVDLACRLFGPGTVVVVVLRHPSRFLASYWKHLVQTGYPLSYAGFLEAQQPAAEGPDKIVDVLRLATLVAAASARGQRVAVAPFEDVVAGGPILVGIAAEVGVTLPSRLPHRRQSLDDTALLARLTENRAGRRRRRDALPPERIAADEARFRRAVERGRLVEPEDFEAPILADLRPEMAALAAAGLPLERWSYPL